MSTDTTEAIRAPGAAEGGQPAHRSQAGSKGRG